MKRVENEEDTKFFKNLSKMPHPHE